MDAPSPTLSESARAQVAGQITFYAIDDPVWMDVLLRHMARGGVIVIERTGDLLIMPAP